jgi:hypothetical protein
MRAARALLAVDLSAAGMTTADVGLKEAA